MIVQETRGLRVLVVEDNVDTAFTLAALLRQEGHEVQVAPDGPTALQLAQGDLPDVALLDIGLPGMDGHDVARWLQTQPGEKRPLLIAITGKDHEEDRRRSAEAGLDLHLLKPVEPDDLRRLLRRFQGIIRPGFEPSEPMA